MLSGMEPAGMDVAAAQSPMAPWLVLGAVLGVALVALAALGTVLLLRRPVGGRTPREEPPAPVDDLQQFLEHPPGSAGAPPSPITGWAALSAPPPPSAPPEPPAGRGRRQTTTALAAMGATALVLVGVAAALAVAAQESEAPRSQARATSPTGTVPETREAGALAGASVVPGRDGLAAHVRFGGVVLERRAVGVTAAYPRLTVTSDGEDAVAHVELLTFNCLTGRAPADPVAAGCVASLTEYADLAAPALEVSRDGDDLRISGRFPTYLRPNGSAPAWTGRAYELTARVEPRSGDPDEGWVAATGVLTLGEDRARTTGQDGDELRFGG
ncbi:hypothetical protein E4P40_14500 [Blastococcus sp. CT_GayMR20]|uniref:hypothetical protein n=1 Tax=Blastococcus sp. CT_GayMR20 TaxID=2559609 RepID=UPI0010737E17|nr:hypothetical protein [Blastococcus sp. CT_GayMR20]TFV83274.1 hypothetical protein E4P40_14500 [Blastococcus sp. CT_GayMR20]